MFYRGCMRLAVTFIALYCGGANAGSEVPFPANPLPNLSILTGTATADEKKAAVHKDMGEALSFCRGILNHYERKANATNYWLLGIAVVGTIAGGVIVPALSAKATISKSAVAAWGGLSGIANATQSSLSSSGLDSSSILLTREKIADAVGTVIKEFQAENDPIKRSDLVLKMYSVCIANDITGGK